MHSGFLTRKLQQKYSNLVKQTMELLTQLIMTYIDRNTITPFEKSIIRLFAAIYKMDQLKTLQPKFSSSLKPLFGFLSSDDQMPKSLISPSNAVHYQDIQPRRPMTTNSANVLQHSDKSCHLQYSRKTINFIPDHQKRKLTLQKYKNQQQTRKTRHYSFSLKRTSQNPINLTSNVYTQSKQKQMQNDQLLRHLTMEQLMQKNRLIDRKMTLFRKKKNLHNKINRIPQLQQQYDSGQFL